MIFFLIFPRGANMYRHIMHVVCAFALSILSISGVAQAVSLGKIDVASHLGEPFYAEVPLGLDNGESIANVFVSMAADSDYRLLEVFHDPAVDGIKVNIKRDQRGDRVELSSVRPLELPFFNVVLKMKHGRATQFKKFAVFLDLPKSAQQTSQPSPQNNQTQANDQQASLASKPLSTTPASDASMQKDKSLSPVKAKTGGDWARTQFYGPMVYGDTITTVAQRLRTDQRFSNNQVMLALFEKNKSKFEQNNINLIKAGTYLDVPTASEVMIHSAAEANRILHQQAQAWKKLTQQSRYAKIQKAQKNRYVKHVSMGENASGVAKHPLAVKASNHSVVTQTNAVKPALGGQAVAPKVNASGTDTENAALSLMQKKNNDLKQQLNTLETKLSNMASKPSDEQLLAASTAQVNKLEIQLARQNGALQKARQQMLKQQNSEGDLGLLTWILIAIVSLLAIVVGYLIYLLKGQRKPPVQQNVVPASDVEQQNNEPSIEEPAFEAANLHMDESSVAANALSDIPDLTDEDTSEMEAFQNADEEPDPSVDYLSEADVYTRYGMDDEAEKQVNMALRLRGDNKDAHIKRLEIRHARGDEAGINEAMSAAKLALSGTSLAAFMATYDAIGRGDESADAPVTVSQSAVESTTFAEDALSEVDEFDLPDLSDDDAKEDPDELDLDNIDWSDSDFDMGSSLAETQDKTEISDDDEGLDFVSLESPAMEDEHSKDDAGLEEEGKDAAPEDDDLDFSGFDLSDVADEENQVTNVPTDANSPSSDKDMSDALNSDDMSLTDLDMDESDLLSVSDVVQDEAEGSLDHPVKADNDANALPETSNEDDAYDTTMQMNASEDLDDLDLDELDLSDFEMGEHDTLPVSNAVQDDVETAVATESKDELTDATMIMNASDLAEIDLSDFDMVESDTLPVSDGVEDDVKAPVASALKDDHSEDKFKDSTVIMNASDDLDLDEIDLSAFDVDESNDLITFDDEHAESDHESEVTPSIDHEKLEPEHIDASSTADVESSVRTSSFLEFNLDDLDENELLLPDHASAENGLFDTKVSNHDGGNDPLNVGMDTVDDEGIHDIDSLNFDDLDIDLDAVEHDTDFDEFTSTIQATLKELGVEQSELDEIKPEATHDFDAIDLSDLEEGKLNQNNSFDDSLELDNLLSELDDFSKKS